MLRMFINEEDGVRDMNLLITAQESKQKIVFA